MKSKLLLVLAAAALVALPTPTPSQQSGASSSRAAAPEFSVREIDLDGLKQLIGRDGGGERPARPLLVNFWATYCEPCRDEFPDLVAIDRDYKARGLEFVTVSLDDAAEIKTSVPEFLRQMNAAMPAYLLNVADPEPAIKWVDQSWGGGLPATYLYDSGGRVVFKHTGRIKPAELRAALDSLTRDGGK
jgi:thiol-disulfide isomerase/thioredoxin